ncbi:microsomal glutathione S-transferase 2-like [Myxocyprinus asiaticus]|uniref:microsomal glutathione S-transferase 2-like n=1 Tax=Myxocyprinus asiaticus TaxID=70543 RepID=UPI002221885A|nr:microsomal glutathione S-transferase 2-like [Myxocyprinus asiaticus]
MGSDLPVLLAAMSILSALHMGFQARLVGWSRMKHKILPPSVTGPAEFERTFRTHQNGVELYPIFLVVLWTSGIFCNEVLAALVGLLYIVGREMYFTGYINETKKRLPGFYLVLCAILILCRMASVGIIQSFLDKYHDIKLF